MSVESQPRNRYVLRRESGHPGFSNVVVLATPADLRVLAEEIGRLSDAGTGRFDRYVTEEKQATSLGAIAFQVITEDELGSLQESDWKDRRRRWTGGIVFMAVAFLAFFGAYTLIRKLLPW